MSRHNYTLVKQTNVATKKFAMYNATYFLAKLEARTNFVTTKRNYVAKYNEFYSKLQI